MVVAEKQSLRKKLLAKRAALTAAEISAASAAVCRLLANWPLFKDAHAVLAYLGFDNEISLQPLLDSHPDKLWAVPRTMPGGQLYIHRYLPDQLVLHPWGMMEPAPNTPTVPHETIELVLIPGVGFDAHGGRLGFGGGYYDRLLPQLDAIRVGIAHIVSCVPVIPNSSHDCLMDWLARPDGLTAVR